MHLQNVYTCKMYIHLCSAPQTNTWHEINFCYMHVLEYMLALLLSLNVVYTCIAVTPVGLQERKETVTSVFQHLAAVSHKHHFVCKM